MGVHPLSNTSTTMLSITADAFDIEFMHRRDLAKGVAAISTENDSSGSKTTVQTPKESQPMTANDSVEWQVSPRASGHGRGHAVVLPRSILSAHGESLQCEGGKGVRDRN